MALTILKISNLNSDSLFENNHQDQQLSTINLCLLHCARISCNLPRNNSLGMTKVIVVERYVINVSLSQNNIESKNVI